MNLGYTIVGNGWDVGRRSRRQSTHDHGSGREEPDGSTHHRALLRVHQLRRRQQVHYGLAYPAATLDKSKATLTVRARLDDAPVDDSRQRLGIRRRRSRFACCRLEHRSSRATSTSSPTPPRIRSSPAWVWRRRAISLRSCGTPSATRPAIPTRWPGTCSTPTASVLAVGTLHQRLPDARLQRGRRRPARHRRRPELDRRRQRRQHQLPVRADGKNRAQPSEPPVSGRRVSRSPTRC